MEPTTNFARVTQLCSIPQSSMLDVATIIQHILAHDDKAYLCRVGCYCVDCLRRTQDDIYRFHPRTGHPQKRVSSPCVLTRPSAVST